MFTPQRKGWSGVGWQENGSVSGTNPRNTFGVILGREKRDIGAEEVPVPPPQRLLGENDGEPAGNGIGGSSSEDWKRFREAGLLDEKVQLRKDKEVLVDRVSALEIERDECLYDLGVLLIEKKEWSSQIEELSQSLSEAQEVLKREQTAHIIVISELEKREDNLKKALGIEKHCVLDLEKALREMRTEVSEAKFTSENKLANAHALEASLEEKQLEIESKVHSADARLAEANRKNSEIGRKLEELEAREHKVQRELSSLHTERKTFEKDLSKQREHLLVWEKELQEKQRRLLDEQRLLNGREERANEAGLSLKNKEIDIEEAKRKVDAANTTLKSQEEEYNERLRSLTIKEKGVEIRSSSLEKKEKDLMGLEEKLSAREREEIQKLLDEHNAIFNVKKQDFELEMTEKRSSFDEEVKNHIDRLGKDKKMIQCKEEELLERKKALDIEASNLKNKEIDLDSKSKALKKWEGSLKTEEGLLQEQRKQILKDLNDLETSRVVLHKEKLANEAEVKKVIFEKENLKLTQEEKQQHLKLQTELRLEKDEYRMMMESHEKQKEALRLEREMFERDWEALDEKRVSIEADIKQLKDERENFKKWRYNEEEKMKHDALDARAVMQREVEDLRLKKETFEKMMAQERSDARSDIESERADMSREFELFKHGLEMNMQRKQDDLEKSFREKKNEFERWREVELNRIKSLSESNEFELRRLEIQQNQLLRDKEEFSEQRQKLDADRLEIQNDIETLLRLSKNLKHQREEFAKEREIVLSAVQKCKICHNCGVPINNSDLFDLQQLGVTEDSEEVLFPSLTDGFLEEHLKSGSADMSHEGPIEGSAKSGSNMKRWFEKCANLFKISPKNSLRPSTEDQIEASFSERINRTALEDADYEPARSASFEKQMDHFDIADVVTGELNRVDNTEVSFDGAGNSMDIARIDSYNGTQKSTAASDDNNIEAEGSSMHSEKYLQPELSNQGQRRQPRRKAKSKPIQRTHSVMAVVEDAKAILGDTFDLTVGEQQYGNSKDSQNITDGIPEASLKADGKVTGQRKKRRTREVEPEDSEPLAESLSIGGRRKKRLTSLQPKTPVDKRYNLRRSTVAITTATSQGTSHQIGVGSSRSLQSLHESNFVEGDRVESNKVEGSYPKSNRVEDGHPKSNMVDGQPENKNTEGDQSAKNKVEGCQSIRIEEGGHGAEINFSHNLRPSGLIENSEIIPNKSVIQNVAEVQSENLDQHGSQGEVNGGSIIEQIREDENEADGDDGVSAKSTEFSKQIAKLVEYSEQPAEEDRDEADDDNMLLSADTEEGTRHLDWGSGSEDEEEDEEEDSERHNASIGKKLWNFFTT